MKTKDMNLGKEQVGMKEINRGQKEIKGTLRERAMRIHYKHAGSCQTKLINKKRFFPYFFF